MCLKDSEEVSQEMENSSLCDHDTPKSWPLHSTFLHTQIDNWGNDSPVLSSVDGLNLGNSLPVRILFIFYICFLSNFWSSFVF